MSPEPVNLAEKPEHQETRKRLASELVKWMEQTGDPLLKGPVASPRFYEKLEWLKKQKE